LFGKFNSDMYSQPLGEKIRQLINQMPTAYPIKDDVISTYQNMNLKAREDLLYAMDCIIDNCKRHIKQVESIKQVINSDTGVKRVK
jgi:hypothetical protein